MSAVVELAAYRRPRRARDLADAQRQIAAFVPPLPDVAGQRDLIASAMLAEWQAAALRVYMEVLA